MRTTYIVAHKNILGGTPVIKGTRIPVSTIKRHIRKANGSALEYLTELYPHLTLEQIRAAQEYKLRTV